MVVQNPTAPCRKGARLSKKSCSSSLPGAQSCEAAVDGKGTEGPQRCGVRSRDLGVTGVCVARLFLATLALLLVVVPFWNSSVVLRR